MSRYFSCKEIADIYGVKIFTVWHWIRNKKLPAIKIGKQYRIREEDLKQFEEDNRTVKEDVGDAVQISNESQPITVIKQDNETVEDDFSQVAQMTNNNIESR